MLSMKLMKLLLRPRTQFNMHLKQMNPATEETIPALYGRSDGQSRRKGLTVAPPSSKSHLNLPFVEWMLCRVILRLGNLEYTSI